MCLGAFAALPLILIDQLTSDVLPVEDRVGRIVQPIEGKLVILDIVQVIFDGLFDQFRSGAVEPGGHSIDLPHEVVGQRCCNPGHVSILRSRVMP